MCHQQRRLNANTPDSGDIPDAGGRRTGLARTGHTEDMTSQPITPTLITDTREQTPLRFEHYPSLRGTLQTGDYSIQGLEDEFCVERKTLDDLIGCMTRERDRFERELHRMRGYRFARVLIVGRLTDLETGEYRSMMDAKAARHTMYAWEARYSPVVFCFQPAAAVAGELVERWAYWFAREYARRADVMCRAAGKNERKECA